MGRVALEGQAGGSAGQFTGTPAGAQGSVSRNRHRARSWKHLGRPAFLPAAIPLDLLAG